MAKKNCKPGTFALFGWRWKNQPHRWFLELEIAKTCDTCVDAIRAQKPIDLSQALLILEWEKLGYIELYPDVRSSITQTRSR